MAHYLHQIVPAPQGWSSHGEPVEGEEFWYESDDGMAQVYPDEMAGWTLLVRGYEITLHVDTPQQGFALNEEHIDVLAKMAQN
jgi:hypothetical protein